MLKVSIDQKNERYLYQISGYSCYFKCRVDIVYWSEQMIIRSYENSKNDHAMFLKAGTEFQCPREQKIIDSIIPLAVYQTEMGQVLYG